MACSQVVVSSMSMNMIPYSKIGTVHTKRNIKCKYYSHEIVEFETKNWLIVTVFILNNWLAFEYNMTENNLTLIFDPLPVDYFIVITGNLLSKWLAFKWHPICHINCSKVIWPRPLTHFRLTSLVVITGN